MQNSVLSLWYKINQLTHLNHKIMKKFRFENLNGHYFTIEARNKNEAKKVASWMSYDHKAFKITEVK